MPGIFKNIFDISKNKIYKIQQEEKNENWIYRMWKYGFRDDRRNH